MTRDRRLGPVDEGLDALEAPLVAVEQDHDVHQELVGAGRDQVDDRLDLLPGQDPQEPGGGGEVRLPVEPAGKDRVHVGGLEAREPREDGRDAVLMLIRPGITSVSAIVTLSRRIFAAASSSSAGVSSSPRAWALPLNRC